MNEKEAKKVLELLADVDCGCYHCVKDLMNKFVEDFPEYSELANTIHEVTFRKYYGNANYERYREEEKKTQILD